jgi:hypothetical protein
MQPSESKHRNHGNEGPARERVRHDDRPYWKRAHHDWRFWVGMVLMFTAIAIYVLSDNLALLPRGRPSQPVSGAAGR